MKALENRLPPPLLFLAASAAMWWTARQTASIDLEVFTRVALAAAFVAIAGAFAFPAVIGFRRARTTVNPVDLEAASSLVTAGIYQYSRNPMYVGLTALLIGWGIWLASPWALAWPCGFAVFITRFQIVPEERVMAAKFGVSYAAYRAKVRRWL